MLAAEARTFLGRGGAASASLLTPVHAATDDLEFSEPIESARAGAGRALCARCGTFCARRRAAHVRHGTCQMPSSAIETRASNAYEGTAARRHSLASSHSCAAKQTTETGTASAAPAQLLAMTAAVHGTHKTSMTKLCSSASAPIQVFLTREDLRTLNAEPPEPAKLMGTSDRHADARGASLPAAASTTPPLCPVSSQSVPLALLRRARLLRCFAGGKNTGGTPADAGARTGLPRSGQQSASNQHPVHQAERRPVRLTGSAQATARVFPGVWSRHGGARTRSPAARSPRCADHSRRRSRRAPARPGFAAAAPACP
jgi:hypothetical protein